MALVLTLRHPAAGGGECPACSDAADEVFGAAGKSDVVVAAVEPLDRRGHERLPVSHRSLRYASRRAGRSIGAVPQVRNGRHPPCRRSAYPSLIADEHGVDQPGPDEPSTLPREDTTLENHPGSFVVTSGFLRGGDANIPPPIDDGPVWTYDEADEKAHEFLLFVCGERTMPELIDDPVEHARANGIMLLFSTQVQASFESYLARMPPPRVEAWRELIAGGAGSEVFGPLTLREQLDERQVGEALREGRRQRIVNLLVGTVVLAAAVVGGVVLWNGLLVEEGRTESSFRFDELDEPPAVAALEGGPPVAQPSLTVALTTAVVVAAGEGPEADRITVAPFAVHPYPPGSIRASLFQFAGSGHIAFVGPEGFTADSCLRASVVTAALRPLDTVTHGPCLRPIGRSASVACLGANAIVIDLRVPADEVSLPEGGSGFADAVRVQLVGGHADYEVLTLRGTIEVDGEAVAVPRFGGEVGEELTFALGADRVGDCTLTGNLPGGS